MEIVQNISTSHRCLRTYLWEEQRKRLIQEKWKNDSWSQLTSGSFEISVMMCLSIFKWSFLKMTVCNHSIIQWEQLCRNFFRTYMPAQASFDFSLIVQTIQVTEFPSSESINGKHFLWYDLKHLQHEDCCEVDPEIFLWQTQQYLSYLSFE